MSEERRTIVKIPMNDLSELSHMSDTLMIHLKNIDALDRLIENAVLLRQKLNEMNRISTCPFCGNVNVTRPHINVICPCGAKFYIHTQEWWDRKTGTVVKEEK